MRFGWKGLAALKTLWLSALALVLAGTALAAPRQRVHIDAVFDPANFVINGRVDARLVTDGPPLTDARFMLYPNVFCDNPSTGGIVVDSLHVDGVDLTAQMVVDTTDLYVAFPPEWSGRDSVTAELWFHSHIPQAPSVYGYDDRQFLLVNWYPVPAPLRNGQWQKLRYTWFLEPAADPSDFSATVKYPDSLQLICGGITKVDTVGDTATASLALERSVGIPLFFGTDYERHSFDENRFTLVIQARDDQSYVVDSLRRVAEAAVAWMSDYVRPYPYNELIVVVGGYTEGGALEEPHMVLLPRHAPALTSYYQEMLIHELVHQWFYATVCNNTATDPWMDEAVTEYLALKINRELIGRCGDLITLFGLTASSNLAARMIGHEFLDFLPLTYSGQRYYDTHECYGTIYEKGPLVIQTLTALMGPDRESDFWKAYVRAYEFGVPTPDDFAAVADSFLPYPAGTARRVLDCTNALDYQIVSLENNPVERPASAPDTANGDDSTEAANDDSVKAGPTFDIKVVYRCVQPLGLLVKLRVTFYDDSFADTVVAGDVGTFEWKLIGITAARSAEIDPDHCYAIDINYLNNSLTLNEARGVGLRLFSGLAFLVESMFSTLWGF